MKKIITIIIVNMLIFTMAGCAKKSLIDNKTNYRTIIIWWGAYYFWTSKKIRWRKC